MGRAAGEASLIGRIAARDMTALRALLACHQVRVFRYILRVVRNAAGDELATAIARCAGCLADSVATAESIDSGEGRAIHCGGSSQIFFDR